MKKTSKQIQRDIISLLQGSALESQITGCIYREGMRPPTADSEDLTVEFIDGAPDQIQTGEVALRIHVADIDAYGGGQLFEDIQRCEQLELALGQWVESLSTKGLPQNQAPSTADNSLSAKEAGYQLGLLRTIRTLAAPTPGSHIVEARLSYRIIA
jgi:hypothetical protein